MTLRECKHRGPVSAVVTARIVRAGEPVLSRPDLTLRLCGVCYLKLLGGPLGEMFQTSSAYVPRELDAEEQL